MGDFKISTATIVRTACLLLALANQVLSAMGKPIIPIESSTVEQLVTAGITTVTALIAWWNNNSFTKEAIQADNVLETLKKQVHKQIEQIEYGIENPPLTVQRGMLTGDFSIGKWLQFDYTYAVNSFLDKTNGPSMKKRIGET